MGSINCPFFKQVRRLRQEYLELFREAFKKRLENIDIEYVDYEGSMKQFLRQFILIMLMAVVTGITFALVFDRLQPEPTALLEQPVQQQPNTPSPPVIVREDLSSDERAVINVVDSLKNSIVSVNTSGTVNDQEQLFGSGSGVAYDEDDDNIYLMTNDHVIADGDSYTIDLIDGNQVKAELVGNDKDTEIAVLKVKKADFGNSKLILAPLGKSAELVVGENVLAIGNALGYGQSVTKGIVSAIGRELESYQGNYAYKLIQTDAPINPGNSGGALVNSRGEVVGIKTIKIADARVEGVGFSIPIESAYEISNKLMELGYQPKTFIIIMSQFIDSAYLSENDLSLGTLLFSVSPNSPAEKAGIRREDIIVKSNDEATPDPQILGYVVRSHAPGDAVTVTLYRDGRMLTVQVTLAQSTQ